MEQSRVFVGNIDTGIVTKEDIVGLFGKFGAVDVVMKQGYAFVQYASEQSAAAAIAEFNGSQLKGRSLTVNFASRWSSLLARFSLPRSCCPPAAFLLSSCFSPVSLLLLSC